MNNGILPQYGNENTKSIANNNATIRGKSLSVTKRPLLIAIYILSLAITFFALLLSVSERQAIGAAGNWTLILLVTNLLIISVLAWLLWREFLILVPSDKYGVLGAKLHVRYVRIFVFAAAMPAILIALFSALTIGRGVSSWLSGQVKDAINATSEFGRQSIEQISQNMKTDVLAMASDIEAASQATSIKSPDFAQYLVTQAERRGFVAVYIINSKDEIVGQAIRPIGSPKRTKPDIDDFATADAGEVDINIDENMIVNVLFKLRGNTDLYLQATRLTPFEQKRLVNQAKQIILAYQTIQTRQTQVQSIFALGFFEVILLVIVGAGWLGLYSASRITLPIAQLVDAAQRVKSGDFSARVEPDFKVHELSNLTTNFNSMTEELANQKSELEASKEDALSRSAFIKAVLDGVSAGVVSLDKNYKILTANGSASRLLGVSEPELFEKGLFEIAPEFIEIVEKAKPNIVNKANIERNIEPNNLLFDVRVSFASDDLIITFDEISSQVASQRQAAWRDVARRIAHEIKNPLTPIQLSAERISRKFGNKIIEEKELFNNLTQTIIRQVTDIGRMVDEFSSFARMPAPKFNHDNICEITKQVIFSQKITHTNIEYEYKCPPEAIKVLMDSRLISQAILNILKNAAEAVNREISNLGQDYIGKIIIAIEIEDQNVAIYIIDNGAGFPKQDRSRLLEPYVTTRAKGTGLGLAIVARIFEEHKGAIRLEDRNDNQKGAVVKLILPLANQDNNIEMGV